MSRLRSITAASWTGYSLPQQWTIVTASGRPQFAFPQRPHGSDAQDLLAPFRPVNSVEGVLGCPGYVEQARPMTLNDKPWHVLSIESRTLFLMIPQLSHTIGSFANNIPCDLMYFDKRSVLTRSLFTYIYYWLMVWNIFHFPSYMGSSFPLTFICFKMVVLPPTRLLLTILNHIVTIW